MKMENKFKVGDSVVWNFVFEMPQECGEVIAVKGDNVQVEYRGYCDRVYRDWVSCEDVDFEANYV